MQRLRVIKQSVIEERRQQILREWRESWPIPCVVIDDFCDPLRLQRISQAYPKPEQLNRSRDFVFAKNKFEKNAFKELGPDMSDLYEDLVSDEFREFLSALYGRSVFVDPTFHGGGLHMGGQGSYLDMHADFNVHPLRPNWKRELNILNISERGMAAGV